MSDIILLILIKIIVLVKQYSPIPSVLTHWIYKCTINANGISIIYRGFFYYKISYFRPVLSLKRPNRYAVGTVLHLRNPVLLAQVNLPRFILHISIFIACLLQIVHCIIWLNADHLSNISPRSRSS